MKQFLKNRLSGIFRRRTRRLMSFDWLRMKTRRRWPEVQAIPPLDKLHFACGSRKVAGWLNVDIASSELDLDLASAKLPWPAHVFRAAVGQMVIDDLEMEDELIPLLKEIRRTLKPGGVLWVSCPDIEKICRSYLENRCRDLIADRQKRRPDYTLKGRPSSQFVNDMFYEEGSNMNQFDFDLLKWTLEQAGFKEARKQVEADFLKEFPEFPARDDEAHSLYVRAVA